MGNPLRNRDPLLYRLISIRTEGEHFWLRPSKDVNKIIGGVLARYVEIFKVLLFGGFFLSNHYHLLIRCPLSNADEFEENLNRELARRLNWKNRRTGKFWSKRYTDLEVLREEDLLEAFLYIMTNCVKHGLEKDPSLWPGVSTYHQNLTEKPVTYPFYHYSADFEDQKVTYHTLRITPLPQFKDLPKAERGEIIKKLISERAKELIEIRKSEGKGFLGAAAIKAQDPYGTPFEVSRSPRPPCYTKDSSLLREFKQSEALRRERHHDASMRYRLGDFTVEFPEYTFKPPLHRKPRLLPFTPLPDDYFKKAA